MRLAGLGLKVFVTVFIFLNLLTGKDESSADRNNSLGLKEMPHQML